MNIEYAKLIQDENHGKSWKDWQVKLRLYGAKGRFIARKITIFRLRYLCLLGPLHLTTMTKFHPILDYLYKGKEYHFLVNHLGFFLDQIDLAEHNPPGKDGNLAKKEASIWRKIYCATRSLFPVYTAEHALQMFFIRDYLKQFMFDSTKIHTDFAKSSSSEGFCCAGC